MDYSTNHIVATDLAIGQMHSFTDGVGGLERDRRANAYWRLSFNRFAWVLKLITGLQIVRILYSLGYDYRVQPPGNGI